MIINTSLQRVLKVSCVFTYCRCVQAKNKSQSTYCFLEPEFMNEKQNTHCSYEILTQYGLYCIFFNIQSLHAIFYLAFYADMLV